MLGPQEYALVHQAPGQDGVLALGGIDVTVEGDFPRARSLIVGGGVKILVGLVVVAVEQGHLALGGVGEIVVQGCQHYMGLQGGGIDFGIAKGNFLKGAHRPTVATRRDAAVDKLFMVDIFVGHVDNGVIRQPGFERRVDAQALAIEKIPMVFQALQHSVQAEATVIPYGPVAVKLHTAGAEGIGVAQQLGKLLPGLGFLGDPVQDAAGSAPAEQQGIGSAQDLQLLKVVQRPVVLDIIPDPINKKISGGAHAPKDHSIPMALALGHGHPGHVIDDIRNTGKAALGDHFRGHNAETLGHIEDGRGRAQGIDLAGVKILAPDHRLLQGQGLGAGSIHHL